MLVFDHGLLHDFLGHLHVELQLLVENHARRLLGRKLLHDDGLVQFPQGPIPLPTVQVFGERSQELVHVLGNQDGLFNDRWVLGDVVEETEDDRFVVPRLLGWALNATAMQPAKKKLRRDKGRFSG